jgi:hypothetical protein
MVSSPWFEIPKSFISSPLTPSFKQFAGHCRKVSVRPRFAGDFELLQRFAFREELYETPARVYFLPPPYSSRLGAASEALTSRENTAPAGGGGFAPAPVDSVPRFF